MNRGVVLSFEGIEGSGKTTQAELLYNDLRGKGESCIMFREPGGTSIGESIREILLDPKMKIAPWSELLLYLAARAELVHEKIVPELKERKIVILDRYMDSTFAYQVFGRGLPYRLVSVFNRVVTKSIKPDITILVDIEPAKGLHRVGSTRDRMESEAQTYHNRVREGYLTIAKRARKRIRVFDGSLSKEEIHTQIKEIVFPFLKSKGYKL